MEMFLESISLPKSDCDFDGVSDDIDIAPLDPNNDSDGDGIANNLGLFSARCFGKHGYRF